MMAEAERRFCRFRADTPSGSPFYSPLPNDGLCLNVFLIIHESGHPGRVLLGHLDPSAPWERLGGMDAERRSQASGKWMLPASQLLLFESPRAAADRLVRELLEIDPLILGGPDVFSEAYPRPHSGASDPHWDLHFLFRGEWANAGPPRASPWKDLAFVDVAQTSSSQFARAHGDILALAGHPSRA